MTCPSKGKGNQYIAVALRLILCCYVSEELEFPYGGNPVFTKLEL